MLIISFLKNKEEKTLHSYKFHFPLQFFWFFSILFFGFSSTTPPHWWLLQIALMIFSFLVMHSRQRTRPNGARVSPFFPVFLMICMFYQRFRFIKPETHFQIQYSTQIIHDSKWEKAVWLSPPRTCFPFP